MSKNVGILSSIEELVKSRIIQSRKCTYAMVSFIWGQPGSFVSRQGAGVEWQIFSQETMRPPPSLFCPSASEPCGSEYERRERENHVVPRCGWRGRPYSTRNESSFDSMSQHSLLMRHITALEIGEATIQEQRSTRKWGRFAKHSASASCSQRRWNDHFRNSENINAENSA